MTEQHKVNTYTMYASVTESPDPVHYEMRGYDTLLGSHYDKYEIDYADYSPHAPPPDIFDIKGLFYLNYFLHCAKFPFNLRKPQSIHSSHYLLPICFVTRCHIRPLCRAAILLCILLLFV